MLKNLLLLPAAALIAMGVAACGDNDDDGPLATSTPPASVATGTPGQGNGEQVEVNLDAVGPEGVNGVAVLAESSDGMNTSVTVTLNDAAATGTAAIHAGTCSDWSDTAVATIGSVQAGYAAGAVSIRLDDIESDDHVVVVVPETGGNPISCGQV